MRFSYSSDRQLAYCPRKWQLNKLLDTATDDDAMLDPLVEGGLVSLAGLYNNPSVIIPYAAAKVSSSHTMYGRAFGAGAAQLILSGGDIDSAIWIAFQHWNNAYEVPPKTLQVLFTSLIRLHQSFDFARYKPLYLQDNRPAVELGTKIWLDPEGKEDYYVLFSDVVVLDTVHNRPTIIEIKTTKRPAPLPPYYTNSPQSVLYSLPLPVLFPEYDSHAWETLYLVNQITDTWNPGIFPFHIEHTYEDRLNTLLSVLLRYEQVTRMRELGHFPKCASGECVSYYQSCEFYGLCDHLALTCPEKSLEEQNAMDKERESQIVLEVHMQELLQQEMSYTHLDQPSTLEPV